MAGYFSLGENKIRSGAYFNVQKRGDETNFGAIDGIVAVLFRSSIGPLGKSTVLTNLRREVAVWFAPSTWIWIPHEA